MTQQPHSDNESVTSQASTPASGVPEAPIMKGNNLLLESMGILQQQHDAPLPYNNQAEPSLSQALTGDERLQAYLMADYLSALEPADTEAVSGLLANDTLSYLQQLAQDYKAV